MSSDTDSDGGGGGGAKPAANANAPGGENENDDQLPALFWDTMPDDPESHPDFAALQALAEESTPDERAENFKTQGNNKVRIGLKAKNRHLLREAVDFYGKGVAVRPTDPQINAALLSNRAHVQILLGNWRHALRDAEAAARLKPADVKARHRAARAALELDELARAAALLRGCGVEVPRGEGEGEEEEEAEVGGAGEKAAVETGEGGAGSKQQQKTTTTTKPLGPPPPPLDPPGLLLLSGDAATRAEFEALARRLVARRAALRRERERERLAREAAMRPAVELARAVLERGLVMAAPAVNRVGTKSARPRLCPESGQLRWPVVFMYPEAPHAPDVIEDAGEDDLLADHLDVMFADNAPPLEWEVADGGGKRYTRASVELYYVAGAGRPLVPQGAPREAQEAALARALHWGWPEGDEEEEGDEEDEGHGAGGDKGGGGKGAGDGGSDEEEIGPAALALREAGGGGKGGGGGKKAGAQPRFARLDAGALTLGAALRLPGHVVAGVPVFWVVARGTEYHARWLREAPLAG